MERGKLGTLVDCLSAAVDRLPERPEHSASRYTNRDAVNGAFGAFFEALRVLIRRRYFSRWDEFLRYVRGEDE